MPPKKSKSKSLWRSADAQHFQLVHRSQRDPLINDPDAGAHVLKSFDPANQARSSNAANKGKTRAQLEASDTSLTLDKYGKPVRNNVGEAAAYGIYYDDTDYDYMQHLRPIHDDENIKRGGENVDEDVDTILISDPAAVSKPAKNKDGGFNLKDPVAGPSSAPIKGKGVDLPASVLPSQNEMPFSFTNHMNVEPSLLGFQPDMDPHLRQALEALDDEAFVDDDLDDDFFGEVVKDGKWDGIVRAEDQWRDSAPGGDEAIWADAAQRAQSQLSETGASEESLSLEARVALFKQQQKTAAQNGSQKHQSAVNGDSDDEDRDEVRSMRAGSKAGTMYTVGGSVLGKKGKPGALARRAASTKAPSVGGGSTAWSMSSSAMFRNKGLSDLDDRFEQLGRKYGLRDPDDEYDDELDALDENEELDQDALVDSDGEAEVVTRQDFESIMDDFLDKYDVKHGKMHESLGGVDATPVQKLTLLREALGRARIDGKEWQGKGVDVGKGEVDEAYQSPDEDEDDEELVDPIPRSHMREKWDVESIQTTKTNVENHPRTITAQQSVFGGSNRSLAFRPGGLDAGGVGHKSGALGNGMAASMTSYTSQRPSAAAFLNGDERLPKIRINPRTGFPEIVGYSKSRGAVKTSNTDELRSTTHVSGSSSEASDGEDDDEYDSDTTSATVSRETARMTSTKRDKNETPQERKERKQALKDMKAARKDRKAQSKLAFATEKNRQTKAERSRKVAEGGPSGIRLV